MFLPVQLAAAKALSLPESWYAEVNNVYRERRELAFKILDIIGCNYSKTQAGMFVWASVPASYEDGFAVTDEVLTTARVFITPGGIFGENGKGFIRISLCSPKEVFSEAIERISSQNKK
jgi:aspartate/methionine/tyrosine aminotransferase